MTYEANTHFGGKKKPAGNGTDCIASRQCLVIVKTRDSKIVL